MSRFLSRVCFRINLIDGKEGRMYIGLMGLRYKLLSMVRKMEMLEAD